MFNFTSVVRFGIVMCSSVRFQMRLSGLRLLYNKDFCDGRQEASF